MFCLFATHTMPHLFFVEIGGTHARELLPPSKSGDFLAKVSGGIFWICKDFEDFICSTHLFRTRNVQNFSIQNCMKYYSKLNNTLIPRFTNNFDDFPAKVSCGNFWLCKDFEVFIDFIGLFKLKKNSFQIVYSSHFQVYKVFISKLASFFERLSSQGM